METEHSENERMHRLLGDALADVEFDADVVPAVLSGYDHQVRIRRYGAAGTALAVLAVAAGAAVLLPRGGSGGARPGQKGPATAATTAPAAAGEAAIAAAEAAAAKARTDPARCGHQHWMQAYGNGGTSAPDILSAGPDAERENCAALTAALDTVFPEAKLIPTYYSVLQLDPRVNQDALRHAQAGGATPNWTEISGEEEKYLAIHPEDPANVFRPNEYTLATPAGREGFRIGYGPDPSLTIAGFTADCADPHVQPVTCEPLITANGWHGALYSAGSAMAAGSDPGHKAVLADDHGHQAVVVWDGTSKADWYQIGTYSADGGLHDPNRGRWINRWTGDLAPGFQPPKQPALTDAQWVTLLSSSAFRSYLNGFAAYQQKLPADPLAAPHGAPATAPASGSASGH